LKEENMEICRSIYEIQTTPKIDEKQQNRDLVKKIIKKHRKLFDKLKDV
jgi:hypothetical protein